MRISVYFWFNTVNFLLDVDKRELRRYVGITKIVHFIQFLFYFTTQLTIQYISADGDRAVKISSL